MNFRVHPPDASLCRQFGGRCFHRPFLCPAIEDPARIDSPFPMGL